MRISSLIRPALFGIALSMTSIPAAIAMPLAVATSPAAQNQHLQQVDYYYPRRDCYRPYYRRHYSNYDNGYYGDYYQPYRSYGYRGYRSDYYSESYRPRRYYRDGYGY